MTTGNKMKNAELDALVSSLSLMRKFYQNSEVTERGDMKILQHKYPDMMRDLLNQIGKVERVIASSMAEDQP